ncbi:PAXIP1-associated glutamate-rich protein 1 [Chelonus insularis]|uniref:PAXIP1-associated glutamate-rich protein 1 n=1 Tax=Chelonus insularis TaxID=460826 RepID=UPI00158E0931|nr:PAXIP1-associated glutamate-rich protein 1 [Chelonus insularis]
MDISSEEWFVDCSDDEKYENDPKDEWSPKPEDLINLIDRLECNKQCLELEWKCPGRRGPSPVLLNNHQPDDIPEYKTEEKDDFDFMDEMASPRLLVRRQGEATPKGSAKKKTASFNGVLSTMLRHRRQEQQEINSTPKKSDLSNVKLQLP